MKRALVIAGAILVAGTVALFGQSFTLPPPAGTVLLGCVSNASSPSPTAGAPYFVQCDNAGAVKTTGSGGGSGGTSSTFGAAFPATGTAVGMSQGGNMVAFTGTSNNLNVQCANCSGSGASAVDEAAFTAGTSVFAPGGGFFQTTATANALTNGQQGMGQMTATRAWFVNLRNAAGTEIGTSGAPVRTDPVGTTTQPVSVATWAAGTLGAMANYGTSPGAVLVPGVNASVTNIPHVICDSGCSGSGGTASNFGSAFPAAGTAIGLTNGTNMVAWSATSNYGTSPGAIAVPAVNANVTNSNANIGNNADGVSAAATSVSPVGSFGFVWNGSTWDRQPGAAATGTKVSQSSPYPLAATPYTATATGTTGATTATLAGAASVTTYICGFSIRANATAAATGNATVTGVITATLNFTQWTAPNASGLGVTEMIFAPCVPASATNTSIAVVSAAPGTGGVVSVTAWGYKL